MQKTYTILWAVKIGDPDWAEQVITQRSYKIEEAKQWATENGFDRFRVSTLDMTEKPDFSSTLNLSL